MIDGASLALALTAGMLAAFNPCGFALLPAYLSAFLGLSSGGSADREAPTSTSAAVTRAVAVGAAMTMGFVVVFGIAGLIAERTSTIITSVAPWLTVVIGIGLVCVGVAMVLGRSITVSLPRMQRGSRSGDVRSMFLFGASYATVSLSCTLPLFLTAVAGTFAASSFVSGVGALLAYALGMGLVILALTIALALARQGVVRRLRSVMRHIGRLSGVLLIVAGAYVSWYGSYALRVENDPNATAGPVVLVSDWSGTISTWIDRQGGNTVGAVLAVLVVASLGAALLARRRGRPTA